MSRKVLEQIEFCIRIEYLNASQLPPDRRIALKTDKDKRASGTTIPSGNPFAHRSDEGHGCSCIISSGFSPQHIDIPTTNLDITQPNKYLRPPTDSTKIFS